MNPSFPHDDELHAYVDGQLSAGRRVAIEAWLAMHPSQAERVKAWRRDAERLRAVWAKPEAAASDRRLDPARIRQRLRAQRRAHLTQVAVLTLALGMGGIGGWQLHDMRGEGGQPPMADAVAAYRLFVNQPSSMDFDAGNRVRLQAWLRQHFNEAGEVPDLQAQGYALRGGRLVSTPEGAAAMLVYQDAQGDSLGVYLRPRTQRMRDGERRDGGLLAQYWAQGDTAFAIVSTATDHRARRIVSLLRGAG